MKKPFIYFLQGIIYIAPIGINAYIIYLVFTFVDSLLKETLKDSLDVYMPRLGLVMVNPISNLEKLGFLAEDNLSIIDEKEKVDVYFPHSYNFSGELFIVPKELLRPIDINPAEVMKFIVSAGVAGWNPQDSYPGHSF
jgi:uncharacterized membrane protein